MLKILKKWLKSFLKTVREFEGAPLVVLVHLLTYVWGRTTYFYEYTQVFLLFVFLSVLKARGEKLKLYQEKRQDFLFKILLFEVFNNRRRKLNFTRKKLDPLEIRKKNKTKIKQRILFAGKLLKRCLRTSRAPNFLSCFTRPVTVFRNSREEEEKNSWIWLLYWPLFFLFSFVAI